LKNLLSKSLKVELGDFAPMNVGVNGGMNIKAKGIKVRLLPINIHVHTVVKSLVFTVIAKESIVAIAVI